MDNDVTMLLFPLVKYIATADKTYKVTQRSTMVAIPYSIKLSSLWSPIPPANAGKSIEFSGSKEKSYYIGSIAKIEVETLIDNEGQLTPSMVPVKDLPGKKYPHHESFVQGSRTWFITLNNMNPRERHPELKRPIFGSVMFHDGTHVCAINFHLEKETDLSKVVKAARGFNFLPLPAVSK